MLCRRRLNYWGMYPQLPLRSSTKHLIEMLQRVKCNPARCTSSETRRVNSFPLWARCRTGEDNGEGSNEVMYAPS